MKIGIISCNFGRIPILRIFCAGVRRLRKETGLDIPCVVAGDIGGANVCREYNITHVEHPNKPLTGKFNRACFELKDKVDYCMILGSDDLISTKAFMAVHERATRGVDLIGFDSIYFYGMDDIYSGKLIHFQHTTVLGVGRTVKASVLDNLGWMPWINERCRGIDTVMLDAVRPFVRTRILLSNHFLVDLKTSWNLNKIYFWHKRLGAMPSSELLWRNIGSEETELIKNYITNQK